MTDLIVVLTVKDPTDVDTVRDLLARQAEASRGEPGCERFEVHQSASDPRTFFLIERWADEAALAAHRTGHAFRTIYEPEVLPKVERAPHPSAWRA